MQSFADRPPRQAAPCARARSLRKHRRGETARSVAYEYKQVVVLTEGEDRAGRPVQHVVDGGVEGRVGPLVLRGEHLARLDGRVGGDGLEEDVSLGVGVVHAPVRAAHVLHRAAALMRRVREEVPAHTPRSDASSTTRKGQGRCSPEAKRVERHVLPHLREADRAVTAQHQQP